MCILLYSSISIQFELLMYYALQLIATSCLSVHSLNDHPTAPSPHISFAPAPSPQPPYLLYLSPQPPYLLYLRCPLTWGPQRVLRLRSPLMPCSPHYTTVYRK